MVVVVVVMGRGLVAAVVAAEAAAVGIIDLFTGLSEYLCAILLVRVGLLRTVVKKGEDGEIGKKIWTETLYCFVCVEKLETILCSSEFP